jgi:hypothetical protein
MKKVLILSLIFALGLVYSCKKEDKVPIGTVPSKIDGVHGVWEMVKCVQVDTANERSLDISRYYLNGEPPLITFEKSNYSYTVETKGKANFMGYAGSWSFDDEVFPTSIVLAPQDMSDIELVLLRTIRPQDPQLQVAVFRNCGDAPNVVYKYYYERKK